MIFGDSYSTTGFWIGGDQPSASNPIGNPALPGSTTCNGLNWVGQVADQLNTSLVLAYDFAVTGATTSNSIVPTYATYNFDGQVGLFQSYLTTNAPWSPDNTLVVVWIGINDVGQSFWDNTVTPFDAVMDEYFDLLQTLHNDGITDFVLFTVPPFDQAPVFEYESTSAMAGLRANITAYNNDLATRLAAFKSSNSGITAQIFNTTPSFETVFNNPTAYGASSDLTCYNSDGVSCVWWDDYHPGQAIQKLVGEAFQEALTGTFF
ncbi:GDSL-like Lipase/Acylhydrolase [Xylariales sp. PMI_506]|nr:GDSL-like Lipase/Acylhydrolase [Xylariales sp. PMI_506]